MSKNDVLPALVGAISSAIAKECSQDEIIYLSALFTQLGSNLALIAVLPPENNISDNNSKKQ